MNPSAWNRRHPDAPTEQSGVHPTPVAPATNAPQSPTPVLVVQTWEEADGTACRDTLGLWGFETSATSDLEDALRHIAEHGCRALVVDLDMPRVDALALVSALRAHEPTSDVAIVATTRDRDGALDELARQSGCDVVLTGALDHDLLAFEVEAALARPSRRRVA